MSRRSLAWTLVLSAALALGAPASARPAVVAVQEGEGDRAGPERLPLRITVAGPGDRVVVDRGASDGLREDDVVVFHPRGGGVFRGRVREVEERTAVVELEDKGFLPAAGTRGVAMLPRGRRAAVPPEPATAPPQAPVEHPPWEREDEAYEKGMPLLAEVGAVRPEDRSTTLHGRLWTTAEGTVNTEAGRSHAFGRAGLGLRADNPFGRGGALRFDGELYHHTTIVPDEADENDSDLRLDRMSYSEGGTRFERDRWEAGRFLQHGMPELGVVDGFEWSRRLPSGDRFGGSLGYMPEPDEDFDTGNDLQVAAFYERVLDRHWTVAGGFQKTWHDGKSDRDLLVGRVLYLPDRGWDLRGTLWVDFYGSGDDAKDAAIELTQAIVSSSTRWRSGGGLAATYTHLAFPELLRQEVLPPVNANQLADDRLDRVSFGAWTGWSGDRRWHGELGAWVDEDDEGGDFEGGLGWRDLLLDRSESELVVFGTRGRFAGVLGTRASFGRGLENGRWDAYYEVADHHEDGFSDDRDDILQHRIGGRRDLFLGAWSLSCYAEARLFDEESSWSAGFYLQRSF